MSAPLRVVRLSDSDDELLIRLHLDWLRRTGVTPCTLRMRRGVLGRLSRFLGCPLTDATFDDLDRWQSSLTASVSTIAGYTSHVRRFYQGRWRTAG